MRFWIVLLAEALVWGHTARAACQVTQRAQVAFVSLGQTILVPVEVNGITGHFVLDTGSAMTVVTPDAVARFHLALDEWTSTTMSGVGGVERRRNADPMSLRMGGVPLYRKSLVRDSTLRVAPLPPAAADGLLGRDFLSVYDVELDPATNTVTLYEVTGCVHHFIPWPEGYDSVAVEIPAENALIIPVMLDGVNLRALLDTGASSSLLASSGIARLGLDLGQMAGDPRAVTSGVGPRRVTMSQHVFRALRVGGDVTSNPRLDVAPIRIRPFADLLLGFDWARTRRLWISWSTKQLFVLKSGTRN